MTFPFDKDICLENNRSLLRPLQLTDAEGLLEAACSDPDLMRYSTAPIHSPRMLWDYLQTAMEEKAQKIRYPFLIVDKTSGKYAGCTSYASIVDADERLEIGWTWMGLPYHRTGLNRNNKFLMLRYAFEELGAERVELRTDERNMRSRTAILGIGATYEGTLRHYKIGYDGFRRNTVYFSILRHEWFGSVRERLELYQNRTARAH
ncbi:GNAT family N-acetyltransferase [Dinghuibacter silviterrae]|uniref:RimJ/RimL family protein N-acetyltransferase n=1 Tax=Dinghuibacter silviterrae TaxID=1539049 RepID=A0A4R8DV41_9BACT|nr:GNAT family N-acetyltransferase [Dinghuibacter silviterrae]TDX01335.1 RimJ/RimL family protein N-acetyltransferase [Dinghuibacter silviterrae]